MKQVMRDLTDAEIMKVRAHARHKGSAEDAMTMLGVEHMESKNFRKAMARRYGITFRPSRNAAHAGDDTILPRKMVNALANEERRS